MAAPRKPEASSPGPPPPRRTTARSATPSVLELVRLSTEPVFPPGGEALYRQIALQTELSRDQVVLDAACGRGLSTEFLAASYGVETHGFDPDPALVEEAERRTRGTAHADLLHFQDGDLDNLPYQDGIFDLAIGEVGLASSVHPAQAIRELTRVTRPMGWVVLVQLIWTGDVDEARREILVEYLGARPLLLVEWKQLLRQAGVVDLHVEDWSDHASPSRATTVGPFHDFAQMFSVREKFAILRRAFRRWGWRGVRGAIVREQEVHRLLTRQRVLGLSLIWGTRWSS
ncbi:MAG: methyltransferase domain-containing protein [Gemmatimonadetes bacterium]|nr:methyltransferase domain-containing protein [Gemmatimonadota bacterium]